MRKLLDINKSVLADIERTLGGVDEKEVLRLIGAVASARRVYAAGAGRSLCVARAFAQRLYQCGVDAYVPGDTNLPPAGSGDMLIACSSSGETPGVLCTAGRAKAAGCQIAAITACPGSSLAGVSDTVVLVSPPAKLGCPQPMGSLFEQSACVLLDCVVILLMERLGRSADDLRKRHGNLE